jgi:phage internal scaffolding protein
MLIRSPYNYNTAEESDRTGLKCEDKSLAIQSQKEESDINTIVRNFGLTGQLPGNIRMPQYGDFNGLSDYHTAKTAVADANSSFNQLPAQIRERFEYSPEKFVEFCLDDKNYEEAKKLGLVVPKEPGIQVKVPLTGSTAKDTKVSESKQA